MSFRRFYSRMADINPVAKVNRKTRFKKVALVGGYVGTGYYGLQMDPHTLNTPAFVSTIENEYRMALTKAGYILDSNSEVLDWSRSSRTDKGVHAARIVFSCKLKMLYEWVKSAEERTKEPNRLAGIVQNTNAHLPENIRLFGCIQTPSSFKAQDFCKWRAYEYILPLSLLSEKPVDAKDSETLLRRFNEQLKHYEGSQSFHNFHRSPSKAPFKEEEDDDDDEGGSAYQKWQANPREVGGRTLNSIYLCQAELLPHNGDKDSIPMVKVHIIGHSFLPNQIRLMISGAVMSTRGQLPDYFLRLALSLPYHFPLPLAPAEGLVLTNAAFQRNKPVDRDVKVQRDLDLAMSRFTYVESDIWKADAPLYTLLTDEEYMASERFLNGKIYPLMSQDWISKSVLDKRVVRELRLQKYDTSISEKLKIAAIARRLKIDRRLISRSLMEDYLHMMSQFEVSAETRALWDQLVDDELPRVLEELRMVRCEKDRALRRFSCDELQRDLVGLIADLVQSSQDPENPVDVKAEIDFYMKRINLPKLNIMLGTNEMVNKRRPFPNDVFLPSGLSSAIAVHYQLYPGFALNNVLRVLATRSFYHSLTEGNNGTNIPNGPWDNVKSIFEMLEKEMVKLERRSPVEEKAAPEGVAQVTWQSMQQRRRLLRWLATDRSPFAQWLRLID